LLVAESAGLKGREKGNVIRQYTELALCARGSDLVHFLVEEQTFGGNYAETESFGHSDGIKN